MTRENAVVQVPSVEIIVMDVVLFQDVLLRKEIEDLLGSLGSKETRGNKGSLVWKGCLDPKGTKVILVLKELEDLKETVVKWECLDSLVSMVFLVCRVHKDLQVYLV